MGKSQAQKKANDIDDIFAKKAPKQVDASATKTDADSASKSKSQMVKEKTDASQLSAVTAGASVKKKQKKAAAVSSSALPSDDTLFTDLKGTKKRRLISVSYMALIHRENDRRRLQDLR